jgi:serine/threonine-protein kinase MDS1/RIM11
LRSRLNFITTPQRMHIARPCVRRGWNYKPIKPLGEGSFGKVFSAVDANGDVVAVKTVEVNPKFKNREVEINKMIDSPYCVKMKNHYRKKGADGTVVQYIVMECMQMSLGKQLSQLKTFNNSLSSYKIRQYSSQIFKGLEYLHSLKICHRDIKPDNILVNPNNLNLKICDFGSAKVMEEGEKNSPNVGSRYYRAPEILLGSTEYSFGVDIWSAGCVIAQMVLSNKVLFAGVDDDDQLVQIMKIIGKPSEEDASSFDRSKPFPYVEQISDLQFVFPADIDRRLLELLRSIFQYNPAKRPTASQCLESLYFKNTNFSRLPSLHIKK